MAKLTLSDLPWPKILISIDPNRAGNPFSTQHLPPLPHASEVKIAVNHLSLEAILKQCVQMRSHALLKEIKQTLKDSPWDERSKG